MRRATGLVAQLALRAGASSEAALLAPAAAQLQQAAAFAAAGGPPPTITPNPLQQIVPPIIKGMGAAVDGVKSGVAALSHQLSDGPATRAAIAAFADKVLLSGTFVDPSSFDLPKWAPWLAAAGYDNKAGWDTLVAAVKAQAASLAPPEVEALLPALHSVGRLDAELADAMAGIIKARFPEFETPGLLRLLPVFAAHDRFDGQLWDDVADAIAYCNHYLAPSAAPLTDIAATFAAYAKYEVDRGDLFVVLARCVHEDAIKALGDGELKQVVTSLLGSFKALGFWPDCTQSLLVAARLRPGAGWGPADNALLAEVEAELRAQAADGVLPWLDGGWKDPAHFHGGAFGSYQLWVTRDELLPQYYKPSDISPRPASMAGSPPAPPAPAAAAAGSEAAAPPASS